MTYFNEEGKEYTPRYEVTITMQVDGPTNIEEVREAANTMLLEKGLGAGGLQIWDRGPERLGSLLVLNQGNGANYATLGNLFDEPEQKANLDAVFEPE